MHAAHSSPSVTTASATSAIRSKACACAITYSGSKNGLGSIAVCGEPAPAAKLGLADIGERDVTDAHCRHRHIIRRPWLTFDQPSAPSSTAAWP